MNHELPPVAPGPVDGVSGEARRPVAPRSALALLCALLVLDFADRQVVVTAFPYLRTEFGATETQLGALVSAVSVVIALGALPAALLVVCLVFSMRYAARPAFATPAEDRGVLAAAAAVQELTAEGEPVATLHGAGIDLLYYCNRRGWAYSVNDRRVNNVCS